MSLLVLVADDEPGIRQMVGDYLELSGYGVINAENGLEALSLLETYHPHLLVSDIKMPGRDGYELVKLIRQKPQFRLLPVIFLTQNTSTPERIKGYQVGCDVYLPKPFELEELGAVVRNLLERTQAVQTEWRFNEVAHKDKTSVEFSGRETEVLHLITQGLSNSEIGSKLYLSPRTVEKYVSSLLKKTITSNRTELVRFALEHNLVN